MASQYYCHRCAAELGYIHEPSTGKKVRTQYQLEKYAKHTAPDSEHAIQSVFLQSDTSAYAGYMVSALLAGAVEVDEQGRHNVVWVAGTPTGFLYEHGQLMRPLGHANISTTSRYLSTTAVHLQNTLRKFEQARQVCTQVAQDLPQTQTAGMSDRRQVAKLSGSEVVGTAGFEPATPRPPVWCASQAALRPDLVGRSRLRVRVRCAGVCVSSRCGACARAAGYGTMASHARRAC